MLAVLVALLVEVGGVGAFGVKTFEVEAFEVEAVVVWERERTDSRLARKAGGRADFWY